MKRGTIDHPKTKRLARAIGAPPYAAMGLIEALVHWAAKYAPSGNVGKYEDPEIEDAVGWTGEPGTLVPILIESGWIDTHDDHRVVIHDWYDHADDSVHMALARATERFWCGREPRLTRLGKAERERVEAAFAQQAHLDTHRKRTENALPSPALPSPPLPSPPPPGVCEPVHTDPCPKVGKPERDAALAAINAWSQHDRQTPLLPHRNELRKFWAGLDEIASMPPVPTPKGSIPAPALVPKAIDAKRAAKTPFRSVAFALGCVRSQLDEWAQAGVSDGETGTETPSQRRLRLAQEAEQAGRASP